MIIVTSRETIDLSGQERDRIASSLQQLFRDLYERNEIVQEVLIDGVVFREGYHEYLLENTERVRRVEIHTVSAEEWVGEIMQELKDYLPRVINALDSISELFYGEMNENNWTYFGQLTEGISWVTQSVQVIRHHLGRTGKNADLLAILTGFEMDLRAQLSELSRELENGDHTAVGDRIKYEFPPLFQTLLDQLAIG